MYIYRKLLLKGGILELSSLENYSAASTDMNSSQFTFMSACMRDVRGSLTLAAMTSSRTWGPLGELLNYSVAHSGHRV